MQGREGAFSKWCELLIVVTIAFGPTSPRPE